MVEREVNMDHKIKKAEKKIVENLEEIMSVGYGVIEIEVKNYKIFINTTFKDKID